MALYDLPYYTIKDSICYVWGPTSEDKDPFDIEDINILTTGACQNRADITQVVLIDSYKTFTIPQKAFYNCPNLTKVQAVRYNSESLPNDLEYQLSDSTVIPMNNVGEFDWNCFGNTRLTDGFYYSNISNLENLVFWGQVFYSNLNTEMDTFEIHLSDSTTLSLSSELFNASSISFKNFKITANQIEIKLMESLNNSLIEIPIEKIEWLYLDLKNDNINTDFISKLFRTHWGLTTRYTMPKKLSFSFANSLMYGGLMTIKTDKSESELQHIHTAKVIQLLPGWPRTSENVIPQYKLKGATPFRLDLSQLTEDDKVDLVKDGLNLLIEKTQEATVILPKDNAVTFWFNNVIRTESIPSWDTLRLQNYKGANQLKDVAYSDTDKNGDLYFENLEYMCIDAKTIPNYLFWKCISCTTLEITSSVQTIGRNAFNGCVNVSQLYYNAPNCKGFAEGLCAEDNGGNQIFAYLGQEVKRGEVDKDKPNMAQGCDIFIGPAVVRLPDGFMYPEGINIHDLSKNTYPCIHNIKFVDENKKELPHGDKNTTLQTIGVAAFKYVNRKVWPANYWSFGTFFEQSQNLQVLGSSAFAGVHSIATLYFPDNLVEIGDNCFNECTKLATISNSFPMSLVNVHPRAFGERYPETTKILSNDMTTTFPDIFEYNTEEERKYHAEKKVCGILKEKYADGGYCFYIQKTPQGPEETTDNLPIWILHYRWVYDSKSPLPCKVTGLPKNDEAEYYKIWGISSYALGYNVYLWCREAKPDKYSDSPKPLTLFSPDSSPKVMAQGALNGIQFAYTNPNSIGVESDALITNVTIHLEQTRYIDKQALTFNLSNYSKAKKQEQKIQYNITIDNTSRKISDQAFVLSSITYCNFTNYESLQHWLFNSTIIQISNNLQDNPAVYKGGWHLKIDDKLVKSIIIQQDKENESSYVSQGYKMIINCQSQQTLNPYGLFEVACDSYSIDMNICNISKTHIFGPYNCFKHTNANSTTESLKIQLLNGYINNGYDLYKNNNTVFYNPKCQCLCVNEFNAPYYVITKWFQQETDATKSLIHYTIYGGNTEEDDLQQSHLCIYNKSLQYLSLPLTNSTDSLIQTQNRILQTWGEDAEGYNLSSLETFKLTTPVNKNQTTLRLPRESLKGATSLRNVELDSRITDIGEEAFVGSNNITSVKLVGPPEDLTLQHWYNNITFASITSSPFYSIIWNQNKDNCKLYINDTDYFKPIIQVGEKVNYIIKNKNNEIEYIKYDPKPFYNYPILGLVFDHALDGTFDSQDIKQANSASLLDITNTLQVIGFNTLVTNTYSVDYNVFKVQNNKLPQYKQLKYIILDNKIKHIPCDCFNHFSHTLINGGIGLGKQVQTLGKDSFLNCASYVGEYELIPDENLLTIINSWIIENDNEKILKDNCITAAEFNHLTLSNQCNLALYANENNIITREIEGLSHKAIYYNNGKFNFLLRYEIQGSYHNKSINLISDQPLTVIDLKAIKIQVSSAYEGRKLNSLTIPWLGTCCDAEYIPPDQYSALKNWFDIKDTQTVKIDTLCIQNPQGIHGFNPEGTKTPVFQNIQLNNLIIEAPRLKSIEEVAHFDTNNINLNSIILKIDEIPTNLLLNNDNLQSIDRLQIQPYGTLSKDIPHIMIHDCSLRTPEILTIIINSQYNQFGTNVFNDNLINDYIYYCNSLKDWVRYNSFGNEKSSPVQFCRKFYTNYDIETNIGEIERILQPDSILYEDNINKWRRFYVNSYSLFNNHQINTIICTHDDATKNEKYTLYDPLSSTTLPQVPFRSNALIEVIADIYHNSISGLVENKGAQQEQGDIYASQCFKVGINASEAISQEET